MAPVGHGSRGSGESWFTLVTWVMGHVGQANHGSLVTRDLDHVDQVGHRKRPVSVMLCSPASTSCN